MYLLESQYQELLAFIRNATFLFRHMKLPRLHILSSEAEKHHLVSHSRHFRLFYLHYIYGSTFPGQNGAVNVSVQLERFNESEAVTQSCWKERNLKKTQHKLLSPFILLKNVESYFQHSSRNERRCGEEEGSSFTSMSDFWLNKTNRNHSAFFFHFKM